jgi:DNA-binding Lrp family transcriptional regulator
MITAIILISTARGRNPEVAQALVDMPKITEVYSVAGEYDLVAIARVQRHDDLADLVTDKVQQLPGITSTNTLIAFKTYSKRDLEALFDIGNDEPAG